MLDSVLGKIKNIDAILWQIINNDRTFHCYFINIMVKNQYRHLNILYMQINFVASGTEIFTMKKINFLTFIS